MKNNRRLTLTCLTFLVILANTAYSEPIIKQGNDPVSIEAGLNNKAEKEESSAFGYDNKALGKKSSAFGNANRAVGDNSSAFGYHNIANNNQSSAFGFGNKSIGEQSSAFGSLNVVGKLKNDDKPDENYGKKSLAFGSEYQVTGNSSGAFGVGHWDTGKYIYKNEGNNSYMIGNKNKIVSGSNDNFILGNNVEIGANV